MSHTITPANLKYNLQDLAKFLEEATLNTYASEKVESRTSIEGYKILIYGKGQWKYEDKYTGYFRSWGSETISYDNSIVWKSNYGGGMIEQHIGDTQFAKQTFEFLKLAMRSKPKNNEEFYLRGPKQLQKDQYKYLSTTTGNVSAFEGSEQITFKDSVVFYHNFIGGLVIGK